MLELCFRFIDLLEYDCGVQMLHQVSRRMHLPWLLWLQVTHLVQPQFQRFRVVVFDSGTVLQGCHSKLHIISLLQIPIGHLARPNCYFVIFALSSLVAHSKLGTCFFTKLCGCGVGEQSCCGKPKFESDQGDKVFKVIACFMGFIFSGMCLFLTIVSITDGFHAPGHIFTSFAECFHVAKTN